MMRLIASARVAASRSCPRTAEVTKDPRFAELKNHLWERLRDATRAAEWAEAEEVRA